MNTLAEVKAAFADYQRNQANLFEQLIQEIVNLTAKVKELTPANKEDKKVK